MHQIRIAELELRNFKGVSAFLLEANGLDVNVWGDNATGKTTLADAFSWLLFDVDSSGRADFEIKTLGADGEPIHNLEHEVRGALILTGGLALELRKLYKETWTKRRGEASKTFTGHTTDHYLDGVPVTKTEYGARVSELAELSAFRLLTDPEQFSERMHWQERRQVLLDVCGDVTDGDVIASKAELEELPDILGKRTIEDARKVINARRRELNKDLAAIPVRIDEARRKAPASVDGTELEEDELIELNERARLELSELDAERASTAEGGVIASAKEAAAMARAELLEAEAEAKAAVNTELEELRGQERIYAATVSTLAMEMDKAKDRVTEAERQLEAHRKGRDHLRARWDTIDGNEFGEPEADIAELYAATLEEPAGECPTCHQALPESMVEAAHTRALERFNTYKATLLEDISAAGRTSAKAIEDLEAGIPDLEAALSTAKANLAGAEKALEEAKERTASAAPGGPNSSEAIDAARETVKAAELAEETARKGVSALLSTLDGKRKAAAAKVDETAAAINAVRARAGTIARIEELERQEEELGAELERLERELYLLETFTRAKVELLEDRINAKFSRARFKLFRELVNGALEECAETVCDGVTWRNLNHGARVQTGLDIINTLQSHYGIAPPVWVDQSESITTLPAMDAQLVRLVVSADDAELRVVAHTSAGQSAGR